LLSHASKILTKIIFKRIEGKIEQSLTEDQFWVQKEYGNEGSNIGVKDNHSKKDYER